MISAIRDRVTYSSRNTSKGSLIEEAETIFEAIHSGSPLDEIRRRALEGDLLSQPARKTREDIWQTIHYRYLAPQEDWIVRDLATAAAKGSHDPTFVSLLYLHYALRDHLSYDFVTRILWQKWLEQQMAVSPADLMFLLDLESSTQLHIQKWTQNTRVYLARKILAALRDFGLLKGSRKKTLVKPTLPSATAEHLLHLLTAEDKRGFQVLEDSTWKLFLCSLEDVADILAKLAMNRQIGFERVGDTVVLKTPENWG